MSGKRDSIDPKQLTSSTTGTPLANSPSSPTKHEGPLSKWTNVVRGWQYRWFVLDPVHSTLDYYLTEEDRSQAPRASIKLSGSTIVPSHEDAQTFILHSANGEVYKLKAHDVKDRQKWVNMIRCVISFSHGQRSTAAAGGGAPGEQQSMVVSRSSTTNSFNVSNNTGNHDSRRDSLIRLTAPGTTRSVHFASEPASVKCDEPFAPARQVISKIRDKRNEMCRLIEKHIEMYMNSGCQLLASRNLTDQVHLARAESETHVISDSGLVLPDLYSCDNVGGEDCAVSALSPDLLLLKASSLASWDCLHQCVFALMNTDATDNGDLGIHDPSLTPLDLEMMSQALPTPPLVTVGATATNRDWDSAQHSRSSSVASSAVDQPADRQRTPSPSVPTSSAAAVVSAVPPPVDGMLAVDGRPRASLPGASNIVAGGSVRNSLPAGSDDMKKLPTLSPKLSPKAAILAPSPLKRQDSRPPVFSADDEEITDVDEQDVGELGSVESEKSVILHLIGQLKIGMDLTKVTLPTFILERRSLLEMFADYLGHAYVLLRIADMKTEEQRMLGVLEWYLTSLHIVRKGTQAKKPYNPIIGETFHCSYKVPNESKSGSTAGNDQLRLKYVGEQVSHHPPVTAFYAECPEKKICMSASIYTQSKFYGLSIGVNLIGTAKLYLVEFGEEYTFTLPSAYARSILTVPWCELGGKVLLECKKSGYSADIVFHTKPFYGGKLHRVTADVNNAQDKTVCKISGEWNSNYEFTMVQDGTQRSVDVTALPVIKKRCRPIDKQDPFESRRLWRKVTEALAVEDIDKATFEKNALEEIQRKGEKERKVLDVRFPNKFFHLEDGTWIFNDPLYRNPTKSLATKT